MKINRRKSGGLIAALSLIMLVLYVMLIVIPEIMADPVSFKDMMASIFMSILFGTVAWVGMLIRD